MHKRFALIFATLLVLATAQFAVAEEWTPSPRSGAELGYQLMHVYYDEPGVMDETGWLHGIHAAYTGHVDQIMLAVEGEILGGEMEYDGQYSDGTPVTGDTDDWLFQLRGLIGYDFEVENWALTPFTGLAYRYWNDQIRVSGGYEREISYVYMPIGVQAGTESGKWRFGASAEYDLFLGGWVKSHLSDAVAGYNDPENDQEFGKGYGLRASVNVTYAYTDDFSFGLEPYFRYWKVQRSETADLTQFGTKIGSVVEPKNSTTIWGLKAMVLF